MCMSREYIQIDRIFDNLLLKLITKIILKGLGLIGVFIFFKNH